MRYSPQKANFSLNCSLVPICNIGCSHIIYPNVFFHIRLLNVVNKFLMLAFVSRTRDALILSVYM